MAPLTLSFQIVLISTGFLSLALFLKLSVPPVIDFSLHQAPTLWSSISSWFKPPYLYIILNCIIITIAASSRFHCSGGECDLHHQQQEQLTAPKLHVRDCGDMVLEEAAVVYEQRKEENCTVSVDHVFEDKTAVVVNGSVEVTEDDFVISESPRTPSKRIQSSKYSPELLLPDEKPLVSVPFDNPKPSTEDESVHETLEDIWKMITEGRATPLTQRLKKSDMFDGSPMNERQGLNPYLSKNRTNYQLPYIQNSLASPGGELRKELFLSQEQLNRRVEEFIKKFNDEMRMQRQESLNLS